MISVLKSIGCIAFVGLDVLNHPFILGIKLPCNGLRQNLYFNTPLKYLLMASTCIFYLPVSPDEYQLHFFLNSLLSQYPFLAMLDPRTFFQLTMFLLVLRQTSDWWFSIWLLRVSFFSLCSRTSSIPLKKTTWVV